MIPKTLRNLLLGLGASVATLAAVFYGFQFLNSIGDPRRRSAKK